VELEPRDPDDAVAGDLQRAVAGAIGLVRLARAVDREPVELDDEARLRPETSTSASFGRSSTVALIRGRGRW
jgi:hypothetical protein